MGDFVTIFRCAQGGSYPDYEGLFLETFTGSFLPISSRDKDPIRPHSPDDTFREFETPGKSTAKREEGNGQREGWVSGPMATITKDFTTS